MAVDLVARLRFEDNGSHLIKKLIRSLRDAQQGTNSLVNSMNRANTTINIFNHTTNSTTNNMNRMSRSFSGFTSRLNPMALGLAAVGTAAAGAYGAVKLLKATVGEAMKMEQSEVIIGAMFNDKGASDAYMKMMDEMAIKSPIFNSQDMYGNSKMYVSRTKDVKQLEKMWKVTERLAAANPLQGTEGAVFSLNELLSGDTVSMVDRFGLDKNVLAKIKKLSLEKQITEMDKYLERIGFTSDLIAKMGNTSLGLWGQVKERSQTILRTMGEPALKEVSKFMNEALMRLNGDDMEKYAAWGGKVIKNMVKGLSNSATRLYDWFAGLINSPEFKEKSTLTGKINFVVDDIAERLNAWYEGGGKKKIIKFGSDVAQVMVSALDATDQVFALGAKMGHSIWTGVINGVKQSAVDSPIVRAFEKYSYSYTPQALIKQGVNEIKSQPWYPKEKANPAGFRKLENSHSGGLDRVPYSGYQATLHKDEKVLTAQQAREHRNGSGGNRPSISIGQLVLQGGGDMKAQAREFLDEIANLMEVEGGQFG